MIITVVWKIRADGHLEGERQTVELTDYVQSLINQKRVEVVEEHRPVLGVVIPDLDGPVAALDADAGTPVPVEVDLPQPGAEGLLVPAKPRAPRRKL